MSLEDKIKEAFKSNKKLSEDTTRKIISKWDSETQPNIYELDVFLRKSGYRLIDIVVSKSGYPELVIEAVKPGYLYPEIFHNLSEKKFYIKAVGAGMIEASDIESILVAYENSLGVLRHLQSLDLSKLEIEEEG